MLVVSDLAIGDEKKRILILDTLFLEGVQFRIYIQEIVLLRGYIRPYPFPILSFFLTLFLKKLDIQIKMWCKNK